ncbi:MAG: hypothetical protein K2R98_17805 [Gemmataceae bacterium]|nr:hypothetical protein [Gemmataceae bacterium]
MTESEWLTSSDVYAMLDHVRADASERKLRLFACAACRRHVDPRYAKAIAVSEHFADGKATAEKLQAAWFESYAHPGAMLGSPALGPMLMAADATGVVLRLITTASAWASRLNWLLNLGQTSDGKDASLVREIFGNPFRSPLRPLWPASLLALAEAQYAGEPCAFALHDALLDAGHPEIAEHFHGTEHPKGCWALDLILNRN